MNAVAIGHTGVRVTRMGCGGAPIAGLFSAVSEEEALATLTAAWQHGIRYFDTAPLYGFGLSEQRLGRFFASRARDSYTVSTKVGRILKPKNGNGTASGLGGFEGALPYTPAFDFSAAGIRRSLEQSLEQLKLSWIDIAYIHDPDKHMEQALRESYTALRALRDEGLVRAIGAGMNQWQALVRFVRECDIDVVMLAGRYTLLDQSALDELMPLCLKRGVCVVAAGVFNSGILAQSAPTSRSKYDYRPADPQILERARKIAAICRRHNVPPAAAAMQFSLAHPAVASVAVGMRSVREVTANVAALGESIPRALWDDLRGGRLIHSDAPVPQAAPA